MITIIIWLYPQKWNHNERFWSLGVASLYHMEFFFGFDSILLKTEAVLPVYMHFRIYLLYLEEIIRLNIPPFM